MYGIANCDTIKKAKKWLDSHSVDYAFHDYKKLGADADALKKAIDAFGINVVVNKRGTTYRKLSDTEKASINESNVIELLSTHTSMIKRPILTVNDKILIGFNVGEYAKVFGVE